MLFAFRWTLTQQGGVASLMNGVAHGRAPHMVVAVDAIPLPVADWVAGPVADAGDWRDSPRRTQTFSSRRATLVATPLPVRIHLLRVGWQQPWDGYLWQCSPYSCR